MTPLDPETETVTARLCAVEILLDAGVTVTVGVVGFWFVPPPPWLPPLPPPPHAAIETTVAVKRKTRKSLAIRFIQWLPLDPIHEQCITSICSSAPDRIDPYRTLRGVISTERDVRLLQKVRHAEHSFYLSAQLRVILTSTISLLFIGTTNSTVPLGPLRTALSVSGRSRVSSFRCAICATLSSLGDPISM
jgi:hypothetical protein